MLNTIGGLPWSLGYQVCKWPDANWASNYVCLCTRTTCCFSNPMGHCKTALGVLPGLRKLILVRLMFDHPMTGRGNNHTVNPCTWPLAGAWWAVVIKCRVLRYSQTATEILKTNWVNYPPIDASLHHTEWPNDEPKRTQRKCLLLYWR